MNKISHIAGNAGFAVLAGFLKFLAWLPFGLLYFLSDIVTFFIHRILRYRVKVVRDNLEKCFPHKSEKERREIEKRFYRNFSDYVFETIKLFHIRDDRMSRRMTFENMEAMDGPLSGGKSVVIYFSHTGNWEWAPSVRIHSELKSDPHILYGQIYRPLRNRHFDALMLKLRSRFGTLSIPKSTALRQCIKCMRDGGRFLIGFMSDQKPSHNDPVRIVSFFGRPTAVITGTETLARRLDTSVVYWDMTKTSRGHYKIKVVPMAAEASKTPDGFLTAKYIELLQQNIERQPDLWLWTHKRWKTSPQSWADVNPENIIRK